MKKLTTEDFIEKAREVHGDKYDYSKVNYINAQEKVCIICSEHGEFWQKPYNHLQGNGCPECIRNSWTTEKFIKKAREVHGDKYDYSKVEYKDVRTPVCIILHELDRNGNEIGEFWQLPLSHLNGLGCNREKRGINEDVWEERTCPICGKIFKIRKKYKKITCSEECRLKYVQLHKDEIDVKRIKKMLLTKSKWTEEQKRLQKEKVKKTCLERYGVENFSQTKGEREKNRINMKKLKKKLDEENKEKILIPKYRQICKDDNLELLEFRGRFDCDVRCKKCGNIFTTRVLGYLTDLTNKNLCRICHPIEPITGPTKFENEFADFLRSLNINYIKNCRSVIKPYEIDFYLPDYKIGIELDGLYWHSELYKPEDYHLVKTEKCREIGVRLIHIFEDEWIYKQDIVRSRIKNILGFTKNKIYARKCEIKEVDKKTTKSFIEKNHIQGNTIFKYSYGLYYNNELVSIMTFGKLRKNLGNKSKEDNYELLRFCNKLDINVIGGASKLLKYFINEYKPQKIVSYADKRWSIGNMYEKIGFTLDHDSQPNYFYIIGDKRCNRFQFRKNILVEKYNCPKDMTEKDFCMSQHWYRIYDCGSKVYEMNL